MTRLCVPLTGSTCAEMASLLAAAAGAGADMVELRLDYLQDWDEQAVGQLLAACGEFAGEVIATYRIAAEGGLYDGGEDERISRLEFVGLSDAVDYIDVECMSWMRSANVRQKIGLVCDVNASSDRPRRRLILSRHDFDKTPTNLDAMLAELSREPAHVVKIASRAETIIDSLRMLDALRTSAAKRATVALTMGETGVLTRVLAKKYGAHLTFASLAADKASAPGQVTLEDTRQLYRWDAIGQSTRVYGVIGCPVAHSMSPTIFNAAFGETGYDGVYLPMLVEPTYEAFADFIDGCLLRPWLGLGGCSVTIPHKQNLLRYIAERGGYIEPLAERIGAANTLHVEPGERADGSDARVSAYNTDYCGAMDALCAGMGCARDGLKGMRAAVLGAGGVSRAIVAGLRDSGCEVSIYNRTQSRAQALASEFGAEARPLDERADHGADIVVNCTSIGMWPDTDASPMPVAGLAGRPMVFDTVYNPIDTRLLREARQHGCRTVDGVAMFVGQAAAQFERWTGGHAPVETMREVVIARLSG